VLLLREILGANGREQRAHAFRYLRDGIKRIFGAGLQFSAVIRPATIRMALLGAYQRRIIFQHFPRANSFIPAASPSIGNRIGMVDRTARYELFLEFRLRPCVLSSAVETHTTYPTSRSDADPACRRAPRSSCGPAAYLHDPFELVASVVGKRRCSRES